MRALPWRGARGEFARLSPIQSVPFHSNGVELHAKARTIGKFEQSLRETNWLNNDFVAQWILASVVFDQRWLDNVSAVRIIREARNKVAGGRQSDCSAPDMWRQAQMVEAGEERDVTAHSQAAAERQVRLRHVDALKVNEPLEVPCSIESFAGRRAASELGGEEQRIR